MRIIRRRTAAVAITAQVRADDAVAFGQPRRQMAPNDVGLWIAVQHKQRRPIAAQAHVQVRLADINTTGLESGEHLGIQSVTPW